MRYLFIGLLFISNTLWAQTDFNSKITAVTVYRNNAVLTNEAGGTLPAGTSEVYIKNISTQINPSSLQVGIRSAGKVSLLSATYVTDYINTQELNEEQQKWKDKLELLNEEIRWAREQKQIYADLEYVLNENRKLGGANLGLNPQDLGALLDLYKIKQYEYNKEFLKFEKEEKELALQISKIQNQLNEVNAKFNTPSGTIKLQVSAAVAGFVDFQCEYLIGNAGWEPIYDLRSEGVSKPVNLVYKANIYQNSGFDWNKVDVTVSTGNPVQNNNRPVLNPLYVDFYENYYALDKLDQVMVVTASKAPRANMAYAEDISYKEQEMAYNQGYEFNNQLLSTTFNTQYEVALPQSIPSDGQYQLVGLESYTLNSEYIYHSVSKLDPGAFLLAKVSNWGQYNLLPGVANIFFEGAYVGQTSINPNVSNDTLLLSLGRDEGIVVKRIEVKDFTSKKTLGANIKETYAYEIEIRNNKSTAVSIEILDQIPVSSQKEIEVELENSGGAVYNSDLGKLEWKVSLAANQSKKISFSYSVKYPKDKQIQGQK